MTEQLDDLINALNDDERFDKEQWMQAIDARLERMRRWGGGKEKQNQRSDVRAGSSESNLNILAGCEKELGPVSGIRRKRPERDSADLHATEKEEVHPTVGNQDGIRRSKGIRYR